MQIRPSIPRQWIYEEFRTRREKNPALSLRGFSRFLKIAPSRLSEILSGKRPVTPETAEKIADRLGMTPEDRQSFLHAVQKEHKRKRGKKRGSFPEADDATKTYESLSVDAFYTISDWYHFAILSLAETRNFSLDERWIADRLNISSSDARAAVERLKRLGLLEERSGKTRATNQNLTTTHDIQSVALRRGHKQLLEKAIKSLDEVEIELRDITSIMMAIDPTRLNEVKPMIREFRRRLCTHLEEGRQTEVYVLCVQLFPLSRHGRQR